MESLTIENIQIAFRKLLSYTYYDNSNLALRRCVAEYSKKISVSPREEEYAFSNLLKMATGNNNLYVKQLCSQIRLLYYPKKVSEINDAEPRLVSNYSLYPANIERILLKVSIPVELMILDVVWLLRYGLKLDRSFDECCYGNRLDLRACKDEIRKGNSLFKKYTTQYEAWWYNGIKIANHNLRKHKNVTIINYDIHNFYHSVNLNFDELILSFSNICTNNS